MPTIINERGTSTGSYGTTPPKQPGQELKIYSTIQQRDADKKHTVFAFVRDASADPTVGSGFALYIFNLNSWVKLIDQKTASGMCFIKTYSTIAARDADRASGNFACVLDTALDPNIVSNCPMMYYKDSTGWKQMFNESAMFTGN